MADILFWLTVVSTFGALIIPLTSKTRGRAILGWLSQWCGAGVFSYARISFFPSWTEPEWAQSLAWFLIAWALVVAGLTVAIFKPRKRDVPVA